MNVQNDYSILQKKIEIGLLCMFFWGLILYLSSAGDNNDKQEDNNDERIGLILFILEGQKLPNRKA